MANLLKVTYTDEAGTVMCWPLTRSGPGTVLERSKCPLSTNVGADGGPTGGQTLFRAQIAYQTHTNSLNLGHSTV